MGYPIKDESSLQFLRDEGARSVCSDEEKKELLVISCLCCSLGKLMSTSSPERVYPWDFALPARKTWQHFSAW